MPFEISYHPLFSLRIEHDYLLELGTKEFASLSPQLQQRQRSKHLLDDTFDIQPTPETERLLQRHRCRVRSTPEGFQVFAATQEKNAGSAPERPLPEGAKLFFAAHLRNHAFLSQANLPELPRQHCLFFSNRFEHAAGDSLQLTHALPAFDPSASYRAGDLVLDDANTPGQLLEAKTDLAPAPTADAAHWLQLPAIAYENGKSYATGDRVLHSGTCYEAKSDGAHPAPPSDAWTESYTPSLNNGVTAADRTPARPSRFTLQLDPENETPYATATLKNLGNDTIWEKAFYHPDNSSLESIAVDASSLPPDFYTIEVKKGDGTSLPGHPFTFFRLPDSLPAPPFALIEIENRASASSHALLDAQGHLASPVFHIRFRKRHAYWRYQFHGDTTGYPPADTGPLTQEDPQDPTRFVTTEPLPFTTAPFTLGSFDDNSIALPPPAPHVTRESDRMVSQIFIHV